MLNNADFLAAVESGKLRAARKIGDNWVVYTEVKQRILEILSSSEIIDMPGGFRDKAPFLPRTFGDDDKVRMVPGGTSVRPGTHIGKHVVIMPPSYVNVGAYIDDYTMVDSHVLVGSCAQIGKRVHLSAAAQICGVLEPVGNKPVIVEDGCFIGAGVILAEGIIVREGAVIAPGVHLAASVPIYDIINTKVFKGEIPPSAVVVPGTRAIMSNDWAKTEGLHLGCAVIVKYRDDKTEASVIIENLLR
jgi:2,3,4,5-tetrahydropyridine-2-carboxylate N-succinyltransferase